MTTDGAPGDAGVPTTVRAYAAVVAASYALRAFGQQPEFPWVQLAVSALLVAGVWRGWVLAWALALLVDLVPVALAVLLVSVNDLTLPGVALVGLGVAGLVLLLAPGTRRHVFGRRPAGAQG